MNDHRTELSFEQAMKELEEIVQSLENGTLTLEQSVELYEQGMKLSLLCEQKLKQVEQKIEIVTQAADEWRTQPFAPPSSKGDEA